MKSKKLISLYLLLVALVFIFQDIAAQGVKKEMNVGYLRWRVVDSADEGEGALGWGAGEQAFFDGYEWSMYSSKAVMLGCKDWVDSSGVSHAVKVSGHGQWETEDKHVMMPVHDSEGWTIKRQYRTTPPSIEVDGLHLEDPFPFNTSDGVGAAGMPGTTDGKITSYINTDMGMSIRQKALGFSQHNHDRYLITEYTFINTGNTDLDDNIELNQTIKGFYFLKQLRTREDPAKPWVSSYGQKTGEDDIYVVYGYPSRGEGSDYDDLGSPMLDNGGFLEFTQFTGEALLFASHGPAAFSSNAIGVSQPHATMTADVDFTSFTYHTWNMTSFQKTQLYQVMEEGLKNVDGIFWPEMSAEKFGKHGERLDERGFAFPSEMEGYGYSASIAYSVGPYDVPFGDSIKVVVAEVYGTISPEKSFEVGSKLLNNQSITPPAGTYLPKTYSDHPELYGADAKAEDVNKNKDLWVMSGRDSLLNVARAAQWAYNNNYNVPQAPPPPSISVLSTSTGIKVNWGTESETAGDLQGYRVYRAVGDWYPNVPDGETGLIGAWEKIADVGSTVNEYLDASPQRGIAQYYAVTAYDDGSSNGNDWNGPAGKLESNFIQNVTTKAAYKLKPGAANLDSVVIVPNPFNLAATQLQYPGEPNKILFLNVPSVCTIRIFTESGDLIKVIEHNGSGDASWGDIEAEHSATETGQIVVSGLYIAQIETPDGNSAIRKFVIVR